MADEKDTEQAEQPEAEGDSGDAGVSGEAPDTSDGESPSPQQPDYSAVIPEELRGRPPEEIKSLWGTLMDTVRVQGEQLKRYSASGQEQSAKPAEPEKDPKETIWDDPEGTIDRILAKRIGPDRDRLMAGMEVAVFSDARSQLPGFGKFEPQIKEFLKANGADVTPANVKGAFLMFKGNEALEADRRKAQRAPTSEKPRSKKDGEKPPYEFKNETEERIFRNSGMSVEEWAELRQDGPVSIPQGEGK